MSPHCVGRDQSSYKKKKYIHFGLISKVVKNICIIIVCAKCNLSELILRLSCINSNLDSIKIHIYIKI